MPQILPYATPDPQRIRTELHYLKVIAISHDVLGGLGAASAALAFFTSNGPLLVMFLYSLAILLSGLCIHLRKLRHLSIIIAAPLCILFPMGTILGLYTLTVLTRPTVIALYNPSS